MEAKNVPEVVLNSGKKMPTIGFGTGTIPPSQTLLDAIGIGYRHFDTASFYNTEEPLGQAVSKSLELGLIKNREELFITSKLWCTDAHHDLVLPALKTTLKQA
jgi:diketogulonate reductase-like aldo/keto reductase